MWVQVIKYYWVPQLVKTNLPNCGAHSIISAMAFSKTSTGGAAASGLAISDSSSPHPPLLCSFLILTAAGT
jgi:hypothetical protein